jgi:hypothetical protein
MPARLGLTCTRAPGALGLHGLTDTRLT